MNTAGEMYEYVQRLLGTHVEYVETIEKVEGVRFYFARVRTEHGVVWEHQHVLDDDRWSVENAALRSRRAVGDAIRALVYESPLARGFV